MMPKIMFLTVCAFLLVPVHSLSLNKVGDSDEKNQEKNVILESLKEFVGMVDKYNLNVSIIGSERKYGSGGWVKEDMSITMHMPVNDKHLTEATLDNGKQNKYLKKIKKLAKTDNVGVKTRVIKIKDGEDKVQDVQEVNKQYLINSTSYKTLTSFKNGVQGFFLPENKSNEIMYNYVIHDASDPVKKVQVITGQIIINELEVSKNFPTNILEETKKVLPKLWLSIDDEELLARLLVQHLDKKFDGNHQVLIGVENFSLGAKKFANLEVADNNVVVFML